MEGGSGHRRRSNSLANTSKLSTGTRTAYPKSESSSRNTALKDQNIEEEDEENKPPEDDSQSLPSTSDDEMELDDIASDEGLDDDEETGLTQKERSKRRRRRRRNTAMDGRILGDVRSIHEEQNKLANLSVLQRSIINGSLIGSWYFFSLSISIYNKWMFSKDHLDFHFPLFTTCLHMLVQFSLASTVLYFLPNLRPRPEHSDLDDDLSAPPTAKKPIMTRNFYITRIGPCGTATGLDIGLGNMSLKFISLTFYTMCKSSALAFVLLFAFVFHLEQPSVKLVVIIGTMTVGVIMMVAGETAFNALGFILIISSAFFSGFRWALTQILLLRHPATSNPFSSIFFLAPIMFVSLLVIAVPVEGPLAVIEGLGILTDKNGTMMGILILLFPGCLAFCMISSEFALLQRTSVVTLSICGIFKEVVTIIASQIVFHDSLTPINLSGLFVTIASIATYNYMKIMKMRREEREKLDKLTMDEDIYEPLRGERIEESSPDGDYTFADRLESTTGPPLSVLTDTVNLSEGQQALDGGSRRTSPLKRPEDLE
ncbi:MAG: Triose-phosphate Transporter [Cirrosporium novae-zelandiae]|nr:MAG: Triose-phosphate Transporter [Cirrosporium novae-zelandiae]